jgi:hypothetical protein
MEMLVVLLLLLAVRLSHNFTGWVSSVVLVPAEFCGERKRRLEEDDQSVDEDSTPFHCCRGRVSFDWTARVGIEMDGPIQAAATTGTETIPPIPLVVVQVWDDRLTDKRSRSNTVHRMVGRVVDFHRVVRVVVFVAVVVIVAVLVGEHREALMGSGGRRHGSTNSFFISTFF